MVLLLNLDMLRGERVDRLKAELEDHGRTCSRKLVECGLWTLYKTTGSDSGRRAGDVGQLQSVAVEESGADETS
jgi:hypothetical protein